MSIPSKITTGSQKRRQFQTEGQVGYSGLTRENQDAIRNKNQKIASLNEEIIELKEDKTHDKNDSSEQQERLK